MILPLVVLRRLDCVLEPKKEAVLARSAEVKSRVENVEPVLKAVSGQEFYNTSPLDFRRLLDDPANVAGNLRSYIAGFSPSARDAIDKFGFGAQIDPEHLSRIVDVVNERFGLELGDADQLLFDQFEESWAADAQLVARARTNSFDNFLLVFDHTFLDTIVKRVDSNDAIFKTILDEPEFRRTLLEFYAAKLYERLRRPDDQLGLAPTPA